jgi:hypothetical protein
VCERLTFRGTPPGTDTVPPRMETAASLAAELGP